MEISDSHGDAFSCGVPSMDAAHRKLKAALARLAALPDDQFGAAFPDLVAAIEHDFRHEEDLMEAINYAGLHSHREEHARVLATLHQTELHVTAGEIATGREALHLLEQWFTVHETRIDAALGAAIERAGCDRKRG